MSLKPLNFDLGDDVDQLRELAQQFATHEVAPLAAKADIENAFPKQLWRQFMDMVWRDAKLYEIGAGTSEIRRMLIGRELFNETT